MLCLHKLTFCIAATAANLTEKKTIASYQAGNPDIRIGPTKESCSSSSSCQLVNVCKVYSEVASQVLRILIPNIYRIATAVINGC